MKNLATTFLAWATFAGGFWIGRLMPDTPEMTAVGVLSSAGALFSICVLLGRIFMELR